MTKVGIAASESRLTLSPCFESYLLEPNSAPHVPDMGGMESGPASDHYSSSPLFPGLGFMSHCPWHTSQYRDM